MKIVERATSTRVDNHQTIELPSLSVDEENIPPPPSSPRTSNDSHELDHFIDNHNHNQVEIQTNKNRNETENGYDQETILSKENISLEFGDDDNDHIESNHVENFENTHHIKDEDDDYEDNNYDNHQDDNNDNNDNNEADEDEWENDDDLGYILIQITEQEFFEMEEVRLLTFI